jgi:chemotaxis phosphatase CheX-like protein
MSSTNSQTTNLPKLTDSGAASAMFDAVRTVAEQSFFAVAEPSDDRSFGVAAVQVPRWLVATVGFEQGTLAGTVSCTLPEHLASGLFDAFTGRDPGDPAPTAALIHDLVGEFSNMVCGAWLTRVESGRTFTLSHPSVEPAIKPAAAGDLRLVAAIDDLPVAVDLRLSQHRRINGVPQA